MPSSTFLRVAGWAALFSAVAIVLMVAAAILGATLRLGNTFSVVVVILMALLIVVALALYLILRSVAPVMSLAATAIGILAMLMTGVAHVMAMAGALSPDQFNTTGEGIGPTGIGLWLLLTNYLALRSKALPRGLTWIGLIAGAGWLLSGVGALIGGSQILPFSIGPLGIFLISPIWAFWLGRRLLARPQGEVQTARAG
jgi:hypothetical protein